MAQGDHLKKRCKLWAPTSRDQSFVSGGVAQFGSALALGVALETSHIRSGTKKIFFPNTIRGDKEHQRQATRLSLKQGNLQHVSLMRERPSRCSGVWRQWPVIRSDVTPLSCGGSPLLSKALLLTSELSQSNSQGYQEAPVSMGKTGQSS